MRSVAKVAAWITICVVITWNTASAAVLFDRSPAAMGGAEGKQALNVEGDWNSLVRFDLLRPALVSGFDVYLNPSFFLPEELPFVGKLGVMRLRAGSATEPNRNNLLLTVLPFSVQDFDGIGSASDQMRVGADFAPILLQAGHYWAGLAGHWDYPNGHYTHFLWSTLLTNNWPEWGGGFDDISIESIGINDLAFRVRGVFVPEPSAVAVLASALAGLVAAGRRRRKASHT